VTSPTLLVGANGQLGYEFQRELASLGPLIATTRRELDLSDIDAIRRVIRETKPALIVNAAAYTAVDRAETDEALCERINAMAPGVMAEEALRIGARLVHFSTDFVFDGAKGEPYVETDPTRPLNVYGKTKLAGEHAILETGARAFVFRISWVYDLHHANFLTTMRRLANERDVLTVVSDQRGIPTWSGSVATAVGQILAASRATVGDGDSLSGIYHMSGGGGESVSWAGFAAELLAQYPVPGRERVTVVPITTAEFPRPAVRPPYSVLSSDKLVRAFGIQLPDWRTQLRLCIRSAAQ
jgi:dTDP-4-dehydrorhamnose reductase